jgi:alginate O-acetyltransferase complex protein AlgI
MVFASLEFLTLFFPLFLIAYALSPSRWRNLTLLVFSWAFYSWWDPSFLWVLVTVTCFAFGAGLLLSHTERAQSRRWVMALAVAAMAGLLAFYKYGNLVVELLVGPVVAASGGNLMWQRLIMPIGISFIVLQGISYIVDVYRHTVPPSRSFVDFAAYKAMFSQLVAGPIVRYSDVQHELQARPFDVMHVAAGLRYFMVGISMKVIVADTLSPLVDACYALSTPSMADAWLGTFAYSLQLFFDFAGYSVMAIGLGQMLGFKFPENFDFPYVALSIQEFWRRWHMTLGSWLRDYLYVPLGGNRVSPGRAYVNLMLIMGISGLWHGADSFNFVIWGALHGLAMIVQRFWGRNGGPELPRLLNWLLTMAFVISAWTIFRASNMAGAWAMYLGQWGFNGLPLSAEVSHVLRPVHVWAILIGCIWATCPWWRVRAAAHTPAVLQPVVYFWPFLAALMSVALMASRGATPFLYFQF